MSSADASGAGRGAIERLHRISLTVGDLRRSASFYRDALGFEPVGEEGSDAASLSELTGMAGLRARSLRLRLGGQEIELVSFEPKGRAYPPAPTSADPWFQHFAIVVADMAEAYGILRMRPDVIPISRDGPEKLPPNTGSVTAYKFRDPEGHPLELTMLPPGIGAVRWQHHQGDALFLGIDHSAIAVASTAESVSFYRDLLGMEVTFRSINRGIEQERLDDLASEHVEITVLQPAASDTPHLELLQYPPGVGRRAPIELGVNDIAATRLLLGTGDLDGLCQSLDAAGVPTLSGLAVLQSGHRSALIRDRDGHLLQLVQEAAPDPP